MKTKLSRIKKDLIKASPNAPDYEGFIKLESKYFHIKGYYKSVSSDLNLYFQQIDDEWIKNKYNASKFTNWLNNNN